MSKQKGPKAVFIFEKDREVHLVFQTNDRSSELHHAHSFDGENFHSLKKLLTLKKGNQKISQWKKSSDFRLSVCENTHLLTYRKDSFIFESAIEMAISKNGLDWKYIGKLPSPHATVLVETLEKKSKTLIAFRTSGRKYITCATSKDALKWEEFGVVLETRERMFDASVITPLTASMYRNTILLLYTAKNGYGKTTLGAAIFHPHHPNTLLWRTDIPLWEEPQDWSQHSFRLVGGADYGKYFFLYIEKNGILETVPIVKYWERPYQRKTLPVFKKSIKKTTKKTAKKITSAKKKSPSQKKPAIFPDLTLERFSENPILEPNPENAWEAFAAFNPAAFIDKGVVHLLYRAQGHDGLSTVGYAESRDGYRIHHREDTPAYVPREVFEGGSGLPAAKDIAFQYMSAGGYGGCEDPKVTLIENRVYLTYVAFNGWQPPRIAISWIPLKSFYDKKWQKWSKPVLISPPGVVDKSAALFPEKINGKYVIFHRIFPNILIDFVDSLDDFDGDTYLKGAYKITPREGFWDRGKLSVGAPPIKTKEGWLVIYHAVSARIEEGGDLRYKIGAMLLDLDDPTKVIVRSREPILEPETEYENNGHKFGIAYPCGSVIKDDTLFVYYGASDKTVAVATAPIKPFLKALLAQKPFSMKKVVVK